MLNSVTMSGNTPAATLSHESEIEVPDALRCAITSEVMVDPVMALDGHTYERSAIEEWFQEHQTSPMSGSRLPAKTLLPNHTLRKLLDEMNFKTFNGEHTQSISTQCQHPSHQDYTLVRGNELHFGGETEWRCPICDKLVAYTEGRGCEMEYYYH